MSHLKISNLENEKNKGIFKDDSTIFEHAELEGFVGLYSFGCVKSRERAHLHMMNLKGIVVEISMSHESI